MNRSPIMGFASDTSLFNGVIFIRPTRAISKAHTLGAAPLPLDNFLVAWGTSRQVKLR